MLLHEPLRGDSCAHDHDHNHAHFSDETDKKILIFCIILSSTMMIVQFIYAYITNSLALLSDTFHLLIDVISLALSLLAIVIIGKFKNPDKTFGYFRLKILVAFVNSLTILFMALIIAYEAVKRLIEQESIDAAPMIVVAIIGLCINLISALLMMKSSKDMNMRSSLLHILGDAVSSVAVILGGVIVYFTEIYYIDTILGIFIALMLLKWALKLLKKTINILLEGSPISVDEVKAEILAHPKISAIHDIHITQISENFLVCSLHAAVNSPQNFNEISAEISSNLLHKFGIGHTTIEPKFGNYKIFKL